MASIAIFNETLKPAQAATGAIIGPVMWASIEIWAAGIFGMFHSRFGSTAFQGSVGHPNSRIELPPRRHLAADEVPLPGLDVSGDALTLDLPLQIEVFAEPLRRLHPEGIPPLAGSPRTRRSHRSIVSGSGGAPALSRRAAFSSSDDDRYSSSAALCSSWHQKRFHFCCARW